MRYRTALLIALVVSAGAGRAASAAEVTISPGDTIRVDVLGENQLSAAYTVAGDGAISIPLAGRVAVGGLTPSDAAPRVRQALTPYIVDPQVSVTLVQRAQLQVTMGGGIARPGAITLPPGARVAEAIAAAGGLLPQANPGAVRIVHPGGAQTPVSLIALAHGDVSQNPELAQGDQVFVPLLSAETGVRIVGRVQRPGLYAIGDEMTLWEAIGAAGGLDASASPRDALVTRASGEKIPVDLTRLMAGDITVSDVRLAPGDTLTVPGMALEVYVLGGVRTPGLCALPVGATLIDAIAKAGGVTPTARLRDGYLLRKSAQDGKVTRVPLRLDILLGKGDPKADVALEDGDKVTIPESGPRRPSLIEKAQPYILPLIYLLGL